MYSLEEIYTEKQLEVLKVSEIEEPRILVCSGAKRAGKTFVLTHAYCMHMEKFKNKGVKFIIGGASIATIQRNIIGDLEEILNMDIRLDKKSSFELWGNTVYCFGGANSDSWKSARGFTSAGALLNEGTALHDSFVKEVISRCSYKNARIFIDTNPENPMHTIKTDYIDKNNSYLSTGKLNVKSFHFTLYDNNFLPEEYIEGIEQTTPSGMYYDRDILGLWVSAEGVVYKDFNERFHVINEFDSTKVKRYIASIDWGYEHHGAIIVVAEMVNNELVIVEAIKEQHKDVIDFWIPKMEELTIKYNVRKWWADSARPEYVARANRGRMTVGNARKEVAQGIETVARMFKTNRLKILKTCSKYLLNELYTYVYKPNSDEPVKLNDDLLDALRYNIHSEFWAEGMRSNKFDVIR